MYAINNRFKAFSDNSWFEIFISYPFQAINSPIWRIDKSLWDHIIQNFYNFVGQKGTVESKWRLCVPITLQNLDFWNTECKNFDKEKGAVDFLQKSFSTPTQNISTMLFHTFSLNSSSKFTYILHDATKAQHSTYLLVKISNDIVLNGHKYGRANTLLCL